MAPARRRQSAITDHFRGASSQRTTPRHTSSQFATITPSSMPRYQAELPGIQFLQQHQTSPARPMISASIQDTSTWPAMPPKSHSVGSPLYHGSKQLEPSHHGGGSLQRHALVSLQQTGSHQHGGSLQHHGSQQHFGSQPSQHQQSASYHHPDSPATPTWQIVAVPEHQHRPASSVQSTPFLHGHVLSMTHPPASSSVASSYNVQYPEFRMMRRFPVNSPLLCQDPVLPLFCVNDVPHPYCRSFEGQDCSSYANRHNKTLYCVSAGPYHGFFRYYTSAWAAPITVQGASATPPTDSLQDLVSKWFVFDSQSNVIVPPYLEPELGVDGDFSNCFWESLYSPITAVQRARSILRLAVWRTGNNDGCPILWDDPHLTFLHKKLPSHLTHPAEMSHRFGTLMAPQAGPSSYSASHHVPSTYMGGTATSHHHASLMGGGALSSFHINMGVSPAPIPSVSVAPSCHAPTPLNKPQQCTIICLCIAPPQSVTQCNPSSTSSSFLVIPYEGSVATMLDTGHPTSATNRMVLNMTAPLVTQVLAPAPLAPTTMLPLLMLNYSRSRNPGRARTHTQRQIQAPREPLNLGVFSRVCDLYQDRT
jgi:hypothetical protein